MIKKFGSAIVGLSALACLAGQTAQAELRVPSSVFTMEELDEAKAKAAKDEEPLIIVYTDPGTT